MTEEMEKGMETSEAKSTIALLTLSKKKKKKSVSMYTNDTLKKALDAVKTGMPVSTAAKQYNIPRTTLLYKNRGTLAPVIKNRGPECIVGVENECRLVEWIFQMSESGFPISRNHVLDSVQLLLNQTKKKTIFTNNRPGRHWYVAFRARHKELTERMSENLTHSRASVTEQKLRVWFDNIWEYFESKSLFDVESHRVFNCDQSAIFLTPKANSVLLKKGEKTIDNFVNKDEKECLITLICASADGKLAPPMVVFPYKRIPGYIASNMPRNWAIGHSENGWMTGATFYEYIANIFYPWLVKNSVVFPVVLFLDGNTSYLTMTLSVFCKEKGIELVGLYPNATHILQPLDVSFFHSLKTAWPKIVDQWRRDNNGQRLRKECFAQLLQRTLESMDVKQILREGFESTGLYPFSVDGVDYHKCSKYSVQSETMPDITLGEKARNEEYLAYIENNIEKPVLQMFNDVEEGVEWTGETIHKSLFDFWRRIKNAINSSEASHGISANNEVDEARVADGNEVCAFRCSAFT